MRVKTLTIIGRPSLVIPFITKDEDDGLVRAYSANLNHIFMVGADGEDDIGYKGGDVRYVDLGHDALMQAVDRNHPSYEYALSFLRDELIPQKDEKASRVRRFICMLRIYPDGIDIDETPELCFYDEQKVYFSGDKRLELPGLRVDSRKGKSGSSNVKVTDASWNPFTGVHYIEGEQKDLGKPAWIVVELSAPGFQTKVVNVPVSGGLVTYCVRLKLKKGVKSLL
jgi:hypothetical protein